MSSSDSSDSAFFFSSFFSVKGKIWLGLETNIKTMAAISCSFNTTNKDNHVVLEIQGLSCMFCFDQMSKNCYYNQLQLKIYKSTIRKKTNKTIAKQYMSTTGFTIVRFFLFVAIATRIFDVGTK